MRFPVSEVCVMGMFSSSREAVSVLHSACTSLVLLVVQPQTRYTACQAGCENQNLGRWGQ